MVLLSDVAVSFEGVSLAESTATAFPLLAGGAELSVRVRAANWSLLQQEKTTIRTRVTATAANGKPFSVSSALVAAAPAALGARAGARGYAYAKIGELMTRRLRQARLAEAQAAAQSKAKALELALEFGVVWPGLTALVTERSGCAGAPKQGAGLCGTKTASGVSKSGDSDTDGQASSGVSKTAFSKGSAGADMASSALYGSAGGFLVSLLLPFILQPMAET